MRFDETRVALARRHKFTQRLRIVEITVIDQSTGASRKDVSGANDQSLVAG